MAAVPKTQDHLAEARRQGQFEGQVLTTLTGIQASLSAMGNSQAGFEGRLTAVEKGVIGCGDSLSGLQKSITDELKRAAEERTVLRKDVDELKEYRSKAGGVLLVIGIAIPILTSVLSALIIQHFLHR